MASGTFASKNEDSDQLAFWLLERSSLPNSIHSAQTALSSRPALHTVFSDYFKEGEHSSQFSRLSARSWYRNKSFLLVMRSRMEGTAKATRNFLAAYHHVDKSLRYVIASLHIKQEIELLNKTLDTFFSTIDNDDEFNDKILREFNDTVSERLTLLYISLLLHHDTVNVQNVTPYIDQTQKRILNTKYRRLYPFLKPYLQVVG